MSIKNATARWDSVKEQGIVKKSKNKIQEEPVPEDDSRLTLYNINIEIKKNKLIGIIGPVGAGKSSFLQAILRELPLKSGSIEFSGDISYASQEPWVFAGSVKQNILFGQEMEKDRYDAVVKSCALVKDFEQLPYGDRTIIGERGASLSGGQKARISLARAVYRRADIYLLDDPLSAVDAHVGRHLFEECIGSHGRLGKQKTTRILVTHQVHYLKDADYIVILRDGKIEHQGSPYELSKLGIDFAKLLESEEFKDVNSEYDGSSKIGGTRSRKSSISSTKSDSFLSLDESGQEDDDSKMNRESEPKENVEESSKGKVKGSVFGNYLKAGSHPILSFIIICLFLLTQACASVIDWWTSYWTSQEELRQFYAKNNTEIDFNSTDPSSTATSELFFIPSSILAAVSEHVQPLSTELCAIIHGSLMAGLFIFAITR